MPKQIFLSITAIFSLAVSALASDFNLASVRADALPAAEVPQASVPAAQPPAAVKDWTIIYYSSGKDLKLRSSLMLQLINLKFADKKGKVNVVAEAPFAEEDGAGLVSTVTARIAMGASWDAKTAQSVADARFTGNGYVSPGFLKAFGPDVVSREYGVDSGDWRRAAAFAKWAKANYPAKHYLFLIYGHGNGFLDYESNVSRSTLEDTESGNYVSVPEMRLMMAEAGKVDLLVMQSCLMQTAEVAWSVKDYADVVLGSSEFLWSIGYPIAEAAYGLALEPDIPAAELAGYMAEGYVKNSEKAGKTGHSSVVVTAGLPGFACKLDAWTDAVMAVKDRTLLFPALKQVLRYDILGMDLSQDAPFAKNLSFSADLSDFVKLVGDTLPADMPEAAAVRERGRELVEYMSSALVSRHVYAGTSLTGFDLSRSGGLAIHLPNVKTIDPSVPSPRAVKKTNYWSLPFAKETRWGDMLHWLYGHDTQSPK